MQKLKDLMLSLQGDKKTQIVAGVIVVVILVAIILPGAPQHKPRAAKEEKKPKIASQESYSDLVTRLTPDLDQLKSENN